MAYRIRDWDKHFENAGSRKVESLRWVPLPNKRGFGYTMLIRQKTGEAMYGCWCALVGLASTCETRGELRSGLHWFDAANIADLIGFSHKTITDTLVFCSKSLDWIEDTTSTSQLPVDYQSSTSLLDGNTPISVLCPVVSCSSLPSTTMPNMVQHVDTYPTCLDTPTFREAWGEWEAHRCEKKKPITQRSRTMALKQLAAMGPARAIAAIENSIANGYQGIFEGKAQQQRDTRPPGPVYEKLN